MNNLHQLETKIRTALPHLMAIEVGQRFTSKYYNILTATVVEPLGSGRYSIYGFDDKQGQPRSECYPRDLELIGHEITIADLLQYLGTHWQINGDGFIWQVGVDNTDWDLSKPLPGQSEDTITFLNNIK